MSRLNKCNKYTLISPNGIFNMFYQISFYMVFISEGEFAEFTLMYVQRNITVTWVSVSGSKIWNKRAVGSKVPCWVHDKKYIFFAYSKGNVACYYKWTYSVVALWRYISTWFFLFLQVGWIQL